jgi:hypothetical protein
LWSKLRVLVVMAALASLAGYGGGGATNPGTTTGTYIFTVTGTGNPAVNPTTTTTFTVTVNCDIRSVRSHFVQSTLAPVMLSDHRQNSALQGPGGREHVMYLHGKWTLIKLWAILMVLAASCGLARAQVVSVTCTDTTSDANTLNTAISGSAVGAQIDIHGTCLVNQTIVLYPDRSYLGDSRYGTVIQQANGANLTALLASQGWTTNSSTVDDPITVAHMTLNGNSQSNSGTSVLVIRSSFTKISDLFVENAPVDGIQFANQSQNGTALTDTMMNSHVSNIFIENSGANGFHVSDSGSSVTDSDLVDSWIGVSGLSAVTIDNAAGWKILGNHFYGVQQNAIYAERCYGTSIESNYIEDFGDAGGAIYYGIACTLQGGVGSVIANNKVYMFATEKSTGTFIYIGVPYVNTGVGILNVLDNVIVGANTSNDTGLSYLSGGKTILLQSSNNVNNVQTERVLGAGVTLVPGDGVVPELTPTVTVTPAQTSLNSNQGLTVALTVTGSGPMPTGAVTLSSGSYTSAAETLSGGSFTFTIPANSLIAGTDILTVDYSGDTNYTSGVGTASVTVTQSGFTLSSSTPTAIPSPGGATTSTVTVSSSTGYAGTVTLTCALSSNTTGDTYLPTCSVPSTSVPMGGTAIITVNTTAASSELVYPKVGGNARERFGAGDGGFLAFLAILVIPTRQRSWRSMLRVLVAITVLGSFVGCGGGGGGAATPGTTIGTYIFTVTGTGNPAVNPTPTTTFTVTVN